ARADLRETAGPIHRSGPFQYRAAPARRQVDPPPRLPSRGQRRPPSYGDGARQRVLEGHRIVRIAAILREQEVDYLLRTRQAADVSRENAIGAHLHVLTPLGSEPESDPPIFNSTARRRRRIPRWFVSTARRRQRRPRLRPPGGAGRFARSMHRPGDSLPEP